MRQAENEKGYALIIVLFAIVFITVLTAVFMKGSMNNKVQEKTVDENNLVVVAAEAGLDYYRWEFDAVYEKYLKIFREDFKKEEEESASPEKLNKLRDKFADDLKFHLQEKADSIMSDYSDSDVDRTGNLVAGYSHLLMKQPRPVVTKTPDRPARMEEEIFVRVVGKVKGFNVDKKTKDLDFKLLYKIPIIESGDTIDGTIEVVEIGVQGEPCPSGKIEDKRCDKPGSNEQIHEIYKSRVFVKDSLISWGQITVDDSYTTIKGALDSQHINIAGSQVVLDKNLRAWGNIVISNSGLHTKTSYEGGISEINNSQIFAENKLGSGRFTINNSILKTNEFHSDQKTTLTDSSIKMFKGYSGGGMELTRSNIEVSDELQVDQNEFKVTDSNVIINGNAVTPNGSTLINAVMRINGDYLHSNKLLDATDSDVFVGKKLTAHNGTNYNNVKMIVGTDYESSTSFKLNNSHLKIGNKISLGNGGELMNTILSAKDLSSSVKVTMTGSSAYTTQLFYSDVMSMTKSTVCTKDFQVRSLTMDDTSRVYYTGNVLALQSSERNQKYINEGKIVKITDSKDYEAKCSVADPVLREPKPPEEINFEPEDSRMESVEY